MIRKDPKISNDTDISSKLHQCTNVIFNLSKVIEGMAKQQERFFKDTQRYINHVLSKQSSGEVSSADQDQYRKQKSQGYTTHNFKKQKEKQTKVMSENQRKVQQFLQMHRKKQENRQEIDLKMSKTMPIPNIKAIVVNDYYGVSQDKNLQTYVNKSQSNPFKTNDSIKQTVIENLSLSQLTTLKNKFQMLQHKQNPRNQLILFDYKDNLINIDLTEISTNILLAEKRLSQEKESDFVKNIKVAFQDELKKWTGEMFNELGKSSYYGYINKSMNKRQMKVYFSRNIIHNFLRIKTKLDGLSYHGKKYSTLLVESFDKTAKKSLKFLKLKYPQQEKTLTTQLNIKIATIVDKGHKIPNLIQLLKFQNRLNDWKDIKQFINALIEQTNIGYEIFQTNLKQLFQNKNKIQFLDISPNFKYEISSKIPKFTQMFQKQQLNQKSMKIKSAEIMRILIKWIQNLEEILLTSFQGTNWSLIQASISNNILRSCRSDPTKENQNLTHLDRFKNQAYSLLSSCFSKILNQILKDYQPIYSYVPKQQYNLNIFSMASSVGIQNLISQYLYELIRIFHKIHDHRNSPSPTFEIYDLFRGRCSGNFDEIQQIMKNIKSKGIFQIVREKNRLNTSNKDYLLNMTMKGHPFVCELQLVVKNDQSSDKAEYESNYQNNFNHFLYQLQRSKFGPLAEAISVYTINSDIPSFFKLDSLNKDRVSKYQSSQFDFKVTVSSRGDVQFQQNAGFIASLYESTIRYCNYCKIIVSSSNSSSQLKFWKQDRLKHPTNFTVCSHCIMKKLTIKQRKIYCLGQFDSQFVKISDVNVLQMHKYLKKRELKSQAEIQQKGEIFYFGQMLCIMFDQLFQNPKIYFQQVPYNTHEFSAFVRDLNKLPNSNFIYIMQNILMSKTIILQNDKQFVHKLVRASIPEYLRVSQTDKLSLDIIEKNGKIFILNIFEIKKTQQDLSPRSIYNLNQQPNLNNNLLSSYNSNLSKRSPDPESPRSSYVLQNQHKDQPQNDQIQLDNIISITDQDFTQSVDLTVYCLIKQLRWNYLNSSLLKSVVLKLRCYQNQSDQLIKLNSIKLPHLTFLKLTFDYYKILKIVYENDTVIEEGKVVLKNSMPELRNLEIITNTSHSEISFKSLKHPKLETILIVCFPFTKINIQNAQLNKFYELRIVGLYLNMPNQTDINFQLIGFSNKQNLPFVPNLTSIAFEHVTFCEQSLKYLQTKTLLHFKYQPLIVCQQKINIFSFDQNFQKLTILRINNSFSFQKIIFPSKLKWLTINYLTDYNNELEKLFLKDQCMLQNLRISADGNCSIKLENIWNFSMKKLKCLDFIGNIQAISFTNPLQNLITLIIEDTNIIKLDLSPLSSKLKNLLLINNSVLSDLTTNQKQNQSLQAYFCGHSLSDIMQPESTYQKYPNLISIDYFQIRQLIQKNLPSQQEEKNENKNIMIKEPPQLERLRSDQRPSFQ